MQAGRGSESTVELRPPGIVHRAPTATLFLFPPTPTACHGQRVFLLFSEVMGGLADPASPLFSKHLLLLDTLHEVSSRGKTRGLQSATLTRRMDDDPCMWLHGIA